MDNETIAKYGATNLAIAESLGLKPIKLDEPIILDWFEKTLGQQVHIEKWWYYELDGENISGTWDTKENAFEHAEIPDYVTDLNVAIKLIIDHFRLELTQSSDDDRGKWLAKYLDPDYKAATYAWSDNPAEAICIAWLNLRDQVDADNFTSPA
jgi:hypothetical protein